MTNYSLFVWFTIREMTTDFKVEVSVQDRVGMALTNMGQTNMALTNMGQTNMGQTNMGQTNKGQTNMA